MIEDDDAAIAWWRHCRSWEVYRAEGRPVEENSSDFSDETGLDSTFSFMTSGLVSTGVI